MSLSIRVRTILALNVFVVGLVLTIGWIAQDVAGQVVEERFAAEMVASMSGFLKDKTFPLTNVMMTYLREMSNADWLVVESKTGKVLGTSLPETATKEFTQQSPGVGTSGVMTLEGKRFRVDSSAIEEQGVRGNPRVEDASKHRLYMLVPYAQFQETRDRAASRVTRVMLPAAGIATILAFLLSFGITRPIRKLASEMDHLAGETSESQPRLASAGPKEVASLAASFYGLLDRLALARQRLAQHERLATLGKVCLSVAHELRNPLSGIKMNMRVLKDHLRPEDSALFEAILREIDRMGLFLNELMSLAPGDGPPKRTLSLAPVKLSELTDSVLTILSGKCRHAKVTVHKNYSPAEPAIHADSGQVRQAMMNLITNAVEAMPAGGNMQLSVSPTADEGVRFSVADTGKGVQESGKDIFEAFASNKPNGVGLGLYICKQVVTLHGGKIGYNSSAGGAVFWFELPRRIEAAQEDKPQATPTGNEHP